MTTPEKSPLSTTIKRILADHHHEGITPEDCLACSSGCCSHGGFAILENVQLIYDRYKAGLLQRTDYEYVKDLSFKDFVSTYFDVRRRWIGKWFWKRDLLIFQMKHLSDHDHLITIPWVRSYYEERWAWFQANPWLNKGCVFLSQKVPNWPNDDGILERHCILHDPLSSTHLTSKPIDCVFYTCEKQMHAREPDEKVSGQWFRALALDYPNSHQRYKVLLAIDKEADDASDG